MPSLFYRGNEIFRHIRKGREIPEKTKRGGSNFKNSQGKEKEESRGSNSQAPAKDTPGNAFRQLETFILYYFHE